MAKLTLASTAERIARLETRIRDLEDALAQVHKRLPPRRPNRVPYFSALSYDVAKSAATKLGKGYVMTPAAKSGTFTFYRVEA